MFYILGLTINFINTARLRHNRIGVYFSASQLAKLFFNGTIFVYADNNKDQFILRQSTE